MKSVKKTIYFHREKEDNWDIEEELNKLGFNTKDILYLGMEIELEIEIFEDGSTKILKIDGTDISNLEL